MRGTRHWARLVWLGAAISCVIVSFSCGEDFDVQPLPPDGSAEASSDGPVVSDATDVVDGAGPERCVWDAPFDKPTKISELSGANAFESAITFTSDEQTVLIVRKELAADAGKVLRASALADGGFTTPTVVPIAGFSPATNSPISISLAPSNDRLYLSYFVGDGSAPAYNPEYDIFVATGNPSTGFGVPARLSANINTTTGDQNPYVVEDEIFFDSDYPPQDGGPRRSSLYSAYVDGGARTRLKNEGDLGLNDPDAADSHAVLSRDRLTIFYGSRTTASLDIYSAHRESLTGRFSIPKKVGEVSTPDHELPLYLSKDQCRLYFIRDDALAGYARLWVATRKP
jgi:hypothetical protein